MATDVAQALAALDAAYDAAVQVDKRTQEREYLDAIGGDKLRHYLDKMKIAQLHGIIRANGYGGSLASLRVHLDAMGVRKVQSLPDGLRQYACRAKGCGGKLVKGDNGYICDTCGAAHTRDNKRRIVLVKAPRKGARKGADELVQASLIQSREVPREAPREDARKAVYGAVRDALREVNQQKAQDGQAGDALAGVFTGSAPMPPR